MVEIQLTWSPVISETLLLAALFVPYMIGLRFGHVRAWLPFIHEVGANDPERCVFTALFNLVALFLFVNINTHQSVINSKRFSPLDDVSFGFGSLACFGFFIMANSLAIKQIKITFFIHCGGSVLFFFGSLVYCGIFTYFSYKETEENNENWYLLLIRCLLLFLYVVALIGYIVFWYYGKSQPQRAMIKISAICQWLLPISIIAFFLTYHNEFSKQMIKFSTELE